ncbi:phosphotransferase-like protein [Solemya velum gill symbiont]|uniref:Phosphotransferase-like protein n=1 Tax=Solemya velum gill symbiont TaxID=2340 RepID=A0A0B0HGA5_SOVGS|nr:phosphotransferase [Solemya velum gill symbiont]KHF26496.1 phosphotransferase-like protein [Solemya velum gill symbiont]
MPQRIEAIRNWLDAQWKTQGTDIAQVSGDASFRRYFRAVGPDGTPWVVMDAPPEKEDCGPFIDIEKRLSAAGLHVPRIVAHEAEQGFLLLEDLGDVQYLEELNEESAPRLYGEALSALVTMQASTSSDGLPLYEANLLRFEMELFRDWLCREHLDLKLGEQEHDMLDEAFHQLTMNALEQPQVFVHRDYHSRNLMVSHPPLPGIIDFQDAVVGPITYDLVSLLKDAYIRWPLQQVDDWAMGYAEMAVQSGLMPASDKEKFQRWFDLMGLQRHIKVAGIFARLYRRDGKAGYLDDIALVLDYILEMEPKYEMIEPLCKLIREDVIPGLQAAD